MITYVTESRVTIVCGLNPTLRTGTRPGRDSGVLDILIPALRCSLYHALISPCIKMASLTSLAEEILANAKRLDQHLSSQHLASTSFDHDNLADLPSELESTRKALINSTQTLKQLSQGPIGSSMEIIFNVRSLSPRPQAECPRYHIYSGLTSSHYE